MHGGAELQSQLPIHAESVLSDEIILWTNETKQKDYDRIRRCEREKVMEIIAKRHINMKL